MKSTTSSRLLGHGLAAALLLLAPAALAAQEAGKVREPLPLEVAVSVHKHNPRAPIGFSPDGEWLAHTVQTDGTIPRDPKSPQYSATGFSFAEGDFRTVATLTHTKTGEVIRLGGAESASWAPVWSPDGERVAFYSDEGGEAGVWVWDRATRKAKRFPGVIARPIFGFELIRWSPDGERLLVKVLAEGRTVAEANAIGAGPGGQSFSVAGPDEPSVVVRRAGPAAAPAPAATAQELVEAVHPVGDMRPLHVDLAILDLRSGAVTRVVRDAAVRWYDFSPDGGSVAWSAATGSHPNSQQNLADLMVVELGGVAPRRLAGNIRLTYGIEWSWSPDGKAIAYFDSGKLARMGVVLYSVADGKRRVIEGTPVFGKDPGEGGTGGGEYSPLWDASGRFIYAVGDGELWQVDVRGGKGRALGRIPGWEIRWFVQPFGRPVVWTSDGGRTVWVTAREHGGERHGIFAVDLKSGKVRPVLREMKTYSDLYSLSASEATGEIAFVSTDQQHLGDVWLLDTRTGKARQATHINAALERYALGTSRLIEWKGPDGKTLKGALLLPPGYREGERLPLVAWVYGGEMGSRSVNKFAFWGDFPNFNFHVLATRGYAVLYPDIPVRTGHTLKDIYEAVNGAVDAAVAQGYADPERLAIMGQSYGSYSTLAVITQTPRFKAAVITAAVLHPDHFAGYLRGSVGYYEGGQGNMGGSPWEYPERYRDNSPLHLFDRVRTPLLIGQGESDGPDLTPSDAIFAALERLGQTVEYRVYEGEEHVLYQKANVLDFWKRRLEFLAEHLKLKPDASGRITAN